MNSLNILLTLLNEQLKSLLHADAEITENKAETLLTYPNPYGDRSGAESRSDRVTKAADAENLTLDSIIELSIRINLLNSVELKDLLANGGTVNVHFWNAAKDYRYRQIGDRLEKF